MLRTLTLTLLLVLFAGVLPAHGQATPETEADYFHQSAQAYLDGELESALETVQDGLQAHPESRKLQALRQQIEDEPDADPGNGDVADEQEDEGDEAADEAEAQDIDQEAPGEEGEEELDAEPDAEALDEDDMHMEFDEEAAEEMDEAPGAGDEGAEMSEAQARQILDAMLQQEARLLREVQERDESVYTPERDW